MPTSRLRGAGWVHRDLKPGNILRMPALHSWTLIDFGCSAAAGATLTLLQRARAGRAGTCLPLALPSCACLRLLAQATTGIFKPAASLSCHAHCRLLRGGLTGTARRAGKRCRLMFSIGYAAPETIAQLESGTSSIIADPAVDMWALGVIAFELLTGAALFPHGESRTAAMGKLAGRGALPWEAADRAPKLAMLKRLKGTVLACLERDPAKRPSAQALVSSWNRFFDATETHGAGAAAPPPPPPRAGAAALQDIGGTINSADTLGSDTRGSSV